MIQKVTNLPDGEAGRSRQNEASALSKILKEFFSKVTAHLN